MPSSCSNSLPVVPVAYSSCWISRCLLNAAHSRRSCFLLSCATRAILCLFSNGLFTFPVPCPFKGAGIYNAFYRPQPVIILTGCLNQGKSNAPALSSLHFVQGKL